MRLALVSLIFSGDMHQQNIYISSHTQFNLLILFNKVYPQPTTFIVKNEQIRGVCLQVWGCMVKKWNRRELNPWPHVCETSALPTELQSLTTSTKTILIYIILFHPIIPTIRISTQNTPSYHKIPKNILLSCKKKVYHHPIMLFERRSRYFELFSMMFSSERCFLIEEHAIKYDKVRLHGLMIQYSIIIFITFQIMNEKQLQEVYAMVDSIDFSRTKKSINRDFADAVMMAELIHYYHPKVIQLHNYPPANSFSKKIQNWNTLNARVLKRIGINLTKTQIQQIVNGVPNAIQEVLYHIFVKFQRPEEQESLIFNARKMAGIAKDYKTITKINAQQDNIKNPKDNPQNQHHPQLNHFNNNQNAVPKNNNLTPVTNQNIFQALSSHNFTNYLQEQQVSIMKDKINQSYVQLNKLHQLNKVKEEMIRNLEKKLQKYIFS